MMKEQCSLIQFKDPIPGLPHWLTLRTIYFINLFTQQILWASFMCRRHRYETLLHYVKNSRTQPTNQLCYKQQKEAPARRERGLLNSLWKNKLSRLGAKGIQKRMKTGSWANREPHVPKRDVKIQVFRKAFLLKI